MGSECPSWCVEMSCALSKTAKGGIHQVFGREIDIDGDGDADMVAFNMDGKTTGADTVLKVSKEGLDHALGGSLKAQLISTHHDGHSELIAIDTTGYGDADTVLRVDDTEGAYAKLTHDQIADGQR